MILDFINFKVFIIAFAIGMLVVYTTVPKPDVIIKYPTPENAGKIVYKDDAGVCYRYKAEEVKCPNDTRTIELQYVEKSAFPKNSLIPT